MGWPCLHNSRALIVFNFWLIYIGTIKSCSKYDFWLNETIYIIMYLRKPVGRKFMIIDDNCHFGLFIFIYRYTVVSNAFAYIPMFILLVFKVCVHEKFLLSSFFSPIQFCVFLGKPFINYFLKTLRTIKANYLNCSAFVAKFTVWNTCLLFT